MKKSCILELEILIGSLESNNTAAYTNKEPPSPPQVRVLILDVIALFQFECYTVRLAMT